MALCVLSDRQESLGDTVTVMLDTDLNGTNGFSIIGPSEDAYAGSAVAGAGVRGNRIEGWCRTFLLHALSVSNGIISRPWPAYMSPTSRWWPGATDYPGSY